MTQYDDCKQSIIVYKKNSNSLTYFCYVSLRQEKRLQSEKYSTGEYLLGADYKSFQILSVIGVAELDGVSLLVDFTMKFGKRKRFPTKKLLPSGLKQVDILQTIKQITVLAFTVLGMLDALPLTYQKYSF